MTLTQSLSPLRSTPVPAAVTHPGWRATGATVCIWFQNHRYKMKRARTEGSQDVNQPPMVRRVVVPILVRDGKPYTCVIDPDKAGCSIPIAASAASFSSH
ncbi:hypothetical protein JZ751_003159, partial [Albula glossodonta]